MHHRRLLDVHNGSLDRQDYPRKLHRMHREIERRWVHVGLRTRARIVAATGCWCAGSGQRRKAHADWDRLAGIMRIFEGGAVSFR